MFLHSAFNGDIHSWQIDPFSTGYGFLGANPELMDTEKNIHDTAGFDRGILDYSNKKDVQMGANGVEQILLSVTEYKQFCEYRKLKEKYTEPFQNKNIRAL